MLPQKARQTINAPPTATVAKLAPMSGAERMRRSRERRRRGLRCLIIVLRASEVEELMRHGWLLRADRDDPVAVRNALHAFLHDWFGGVTLFRPKARTGKPVPS